MFGAPREELALQMTLCHLSKWALPALSGTQLAVLWLVVERGRVLTCSLSLTPAHSASLPPSSSVPRVVAVSPQMRLVEDNPSSLSLVEIYKQRCAKKGIEHDNPISRYYDRLATVQARGTQASHQVPGRRPATSRGLRPCCLVAVGCSARDSTSHEMGKIRWLVTICCRGFVVRFLTSESPLSLPCTYRKAQNIDVKHQWVPCSLGSQ